MDIQATKLKLIQQVLETPDEHVLKRISEVFEEESNQDFWDNLDEDLKASIERGIAQADKGEVKSHEEVMSKYKKWL